MNTSKPEKVIIIRRWVLLFLFIIPRLVISQEVHPRFNTFTIEEGLSQNSVYSITKSEDGFIWLGTIDGLNRIDGRDIKIIYPVTRDGESHSSIIYSLLYDDGLIWVGTESGVFIYDKEKDIFYYTYEIFDQLIIPEDFSTSQIFMDNSGNYWFVSNTQGVILYKTTNHKYYHYFKESLANQDIVGICESGKGKVYIATSENIWFQDGNLFKRFDIKTSFGEEVHNIRTITATENGFIISDEKSGLLQYEDNYSRYPILIDQWLDLPNDVHEILNVGDTIIWMGTRTNGLLRIDIRNDNKFEFFKKGTAVHDLKSNFILSLFRDDEERLWLGTSGGGVSVFYLERPILNQYIPSELSGVLDGDNMALSIASFDPGVIYIGSLNGGLMKFDIDKNHLTYLWDSDYPVTTSNVYNIVKDDNKLWLATWGGLCSVDLESQEWSCHTTSNDPIQLYSIFPIRQNHLLLGGEEGLSLYDKTSGRFHLPADRDNILYYKTLKTRFIDEYKKNQLLLATSNEGLVKYDISTGEFTFYEEIKNISKSCRHFSIGKNFLWLATDRGLLQLDKENLNIIDIWELSDGLNNSFIYSVLEDNNGFVWVATNGGLSRIQPEDKNILNLGMADGLQSLEFNTSAALKEKNGRLWFGGIHGLNSYENFQINVPIPEKPLITNIQVNNHNYQDTIDYPYQEFIKLDHTQNSISFEFASPSEISGRNIEYSYKLLGFDEDWISSGRRNFVNYPQLSPSLYTFMVKAIADGKESPINDTLFIQIHSAFWQTNLFKFIVALALISIVIIVIQYRKRSIEKKLERERKIHALESKALKAQMNPHFIFNTLNSIKHYSLFKDREETSAYITKFSSIIRKILVNSDHKMISLKEEIDWLTQYIELEQKRFDTDFTWKIIVEPDLSLENNFIPPMILQPLIENAIWHGLLPKEGDKKLIIEFSNFHDGFQCIIKDNGVGREASNKSKSSHSKKSYGIDITKGRLEHIGHLNNLEYNLNAEDLTNDVENPGTKVTFQLFPSQVYY